VLRQPIDTHVRTCHHTDAMRDSLGRRRQPSQNKGLRPLYPPLPKNLVSRSIRIAMSHTAWARLEQQARNQSAKTQPRAIGEILERALEPQPDWQDWQIRKEKQLLAS
jgi:hypothetical protein